MAHILEYTILYVTATKELIACNNGSQVLVIDEQVYTTVIYADYAALIIGMDAIGIDYSGWRRVWLNTGE